MPPPNNCRCFLLWSASAEGVASLHAPRDGSRVTCSWDQARSVLGNGAEEEIRFDAGAPDPEEQSVGRSLLGRKLETISRTLRRLQAGGVLQKEGRQLKLLDLVALRTCAEHVGERFIPRRQLTRLRGARAA